MKNPCTMTEVKSSQLKAIGYCPATKTLACQFLRGDQKTALYPGVEPEQFEAFRTSESLGKHFGAHIKTRKDFSYADAPEKAEAEEAKA